MRRPPIPIDGTKETPIGTAAIWSGSGGLSAVGQRGSYIIYGVTIASSSAWARTKHGRLGPTPFATECRGNEIVVGGTIVGRRPCCR